MNDRQVKQAISSQYHATLEMLKQAIVQCPHEMWDDPAQKNRFWHIAYHALFYTHLYLQHEEADFVPWEKQQDAYCSLGSDPARPEEPETGTPYEKGDLLDYLAFCRNVVDDLVPALDLDAESGFRWIPFNKLELQFYNIRHVQQHTGELCERLGVQAGIDVQWVGMAPN
jgi:hypothetical protein